MGLGRILWSQQKYVHFIQRFARVEEVAAAIIFLAGPDAGFITGSIIDVNGGFTA